MNLSGQQMADIGTALKVTGAAGATLAATGAGIGLALLLSPVLSA